MLLFTAQHAITYVACIQHAFNTHLAGREERCGELRCKLLCRTEVGVMGAVVGTRASVEEEGVVKEGVKEGVLLLCAGCAEVYRLDGPVQYGVCVCVCVHVFVCTRF